MSAVSGLQLLSRSGTTSLREVTIEAGPTEAGMVLLSIRSAAAGHRQGQYAMTVDAWRQLTGAEPPAAREEVPAP